MKLSKQLMHDLKLALPNASQSALCSMPQIIYANASNTSTETWNQRRVKLQSPDISEANGSS